MLVFLTLKKFVGRALLVQLGLGLGVVPQGDWWCSTVSTSSASAPSVALCCVVLRLIFFWFLSCSFRLPTGTARRGRGHRRTVSAPVPQFQFPQVLYPPMAPAAPSSAAAVAAVPLPGDGRPRPVESAVSSPVPKRARTTRNTSYSNTTVAGRAPPLDFFKLGDRGVLCNRHRILLPEDLLSKPSLICPTKIVDKNLLPKRLSLKSKRIRSSAPKKPSRLRGTLHQTSKST